MIPERKLTVELLSDTTFGRGDGVAGLVDDEIEHDTMTGLPIIRGRTLKGLLVEECANILFSLAPNDQTWHAVAQWLFGTPGSSAEVQGHLRVGQAELHEELQAAVAAGRYTSAQILESLTTIRRQTAVDEATGVPASGSLRSARVALRGLVFSAPLRFTRLPTNEHIALLCACAAAVRRGGSGRNRGRGRLKVAITASPPDAAVFNMDEWLEFFATKVEPIL